MRSKRTSIVVFILILLIQHVGGQSLSNETIIKEINRQIFDTDGELTGSYTLTNKYHEVNYGRVKTETIVDPNDERVVRQFNLQGSMVKYEVYRHDKLNDDFTYEYGDDGVSLIRERGTYNLDYFQIDSNNYIGKIAFGNGIGFNFDLDTIFVHETKFEYELTRKKKSKNKTIDRYDSRFTKNGSLQSVTIYENDVKVGHILNKYNNLNQVIERQDFWQYDLFANEEDWSEYLSNRVYKFSYDTTGFIHSFTTEIYSPVDRKWDIQVQNFECSLEQEEKHYKAKCLTDDGGYYNIEIDKHGNWTRRDEFSNGELTVTTRELSYYE